MNILCSSIVQASGKIRQHTTIIGRVTTNLSGIRNNNVLDNRLEHFSLSSLDFQHHGTGQTTIRTLPKFIYVQNPLTWVINKLDFRMLRSAWDPEFDEEDFKRGTKQAVSVICYYISENLWDNLKGLVTRQALSRLQRDVETNWTEEQRRHITLEPEDIKLSLPRKIHFLRISDQRFVDIDMFFVGMKFKEKAPSAIKDVIFIELAARFHRNYTAGQLPNWTVSLLKVTRFNILRPAVGDGKEM